MEEEKEEKDIRTFDDLGFEYEVLDGLDAMGFTTPTPVQALAIPPVMNGKDIIACAQTGTGKTAAYLLPVINKITKDGSKGVNTIIVAPTRELAVQIDQQVEGFSYFVSVSSAPIYGGGDAGAWERQKQALVKGADIIIATPGRLIAHLNLGYAKLDAVQHLILDEADRMLDMGFHDDIMKIISYLPKKRQNLLFSATMPPKIRTLAKTILTDPASVNIAISKPAAGILQAAYMVYENQKLPLLKGLLNDKKDLSIIIFSSTKKNVKLLAKELSRGGFNAAGIHSDLEQADREAVMQKFKAGRIQIIVGTDIISRGIDVEGIGLVINYDVPSDGEDYVHRVGRTARADKTGVALTFITEKDQRDFGKIEKLIEKDINKLDLPKELGEGPKYDPTKRSFGRPGGRSGGSRHSGGNRNKKGGNKSRTGKSNNYRGSKGGNRSNKSKSGGGNSGKPPGEKG